MSWRYPFDDSWCEFVESIDNVLVHSDGKWVPWFYGGPGVALGVNTADYKVGALSIEMACFASNYSEVQYELRLVLDDGKELDLTDGKLFEFWMKATQIIGAGAVKPVVTVRFWDGEPGLSRQASRNFQLTINDWQHENVKVGAEAIVEWIVQSGFDWTHIKEIHFVFEQEKCDYAHPVTTFFRVDGLLFHFLRDVSLISVDSNPISDVPVRIDSVQGLTPVIWEIVPPGIMEVTVADEHEGWIFDRWDDEVLTPGRTVDASLPGVYPFTAFYKQSTFPRWHPGYYLQQLIKRLKERLAIVI